MKCAQCGTKLKVLETRDDGSVVYRTRKCLPCDFLYTTKEELVDGVGDLPMPYEHRVRAEGGKRPRRRKSNG